MKTKRFLVPIIVLILLVGILFGGFFVYKKFIYKDTSYVGQWTRQVDMTEFVTDVMDIWLDDSIDGDLAEYGNERVVISINLVMNSNGSWSESVDEAVYAEAQQQAIRVAAAGLTSFLEKRLATAEVTPESVGKTVEELVQEAIGMSAEDYIKNYGPELLPSITDLNKTYAHNGSYKVEKGILARTGLAEDTVYEIYSVQDDFLLISAKSDKDEGIVVENATTNSIGVAIDSSDNDSQTDTSSTDTSDTSDGTSDSQNVSPAVGVVYPLVYVRK